MVLVEAKRIISSTNVDLNFVSSEEANGQKLAAVVDRVNQVEEFKDVAGLESIDLCTESIVVQVNVWVHVNCTSVVSERDTLTSKCWAVAGVLEQSCTVLHIHCSVLSNDPTASTKVVLDEINPLIADEYCTIIGNGLRWCQRGRSKNIVSECGTDTAVSVDFLESDQTIVDTIGSTVEGVETAKLITSTTELERSVVLQGVE